MLDIFSLTLPSKRGVLTGLGFKDPKNLEGNSWLDQHTDSKL